MPTTDTEKIERKIAEHARQCPAHATAVQVRAAVDDLREDFRGHRQSMEEVKDTFRDGAIEFARLKARDSSHEERLAKVEAFVDETRSFFQRIAMRIIIALVLSAAAAVGAGHGITAIISAIGDNS